MLLASINKCHLAAIDGFEEEFYAYKLQHYKEMSTRMEIIKRWAKRKIMKHAQMTRL